MGPVTGDDAGWMARALELARRGIGLSSPNPAVGCVILDRDGALAGEGWHDYDRRDHAEVVALRAAGELADGTLPYLAGPRTLDSFIVPGITKAAEAAGRPAPRIAAGVPASVTGDPERARTQAFQALGGYARTPAYQAVLEREGITNVADLALIGDEATVAAGIRRYLDAGATDVRISPAAFATDEERVRTWQLVGQLARDAGGRGGVL